MDPLCRRLFLEIGLKLTGSPGCISGIEPQCVIDLVAGGLVAGINVLQHHSDSLGYVSDSRELALPARRAVGRSNLPVPISPNSTWVGARAK